MPRSSTDREVDVAVSRLTFHTSALPMDTTSVALILLRSPLRLEEAGAPRAVRSLPKTIGASCIVQIGDVAVGEGCTVDTKGQLQFHATTTYHHEHDLCDPLAPLDAQGVAGSLSPSRVLELWLVVFPPNTSSGGPAFTCVASGSIPLPFALFNASVDAHRIGGCNGVSELPLFSPTASDLCPVAVVSLTVRDHLAVKCARRSACLVNTQGQPSFYRSRGHQQSRVAANVASGVQKTAQRLLNKVRSAFDASSSSDENPRELPTSPGREATQCAFFEIPSASSSAAVLLQFDGTLALVEFLEHRQQHVPGSVLVICETWEGESTRRSVADHLSAMGWPVTLLLLFIAHDSLGDDARRVYRDLRTALSTFVCGAREAHVLPAVWFLCSDSLASECLAVMVAGLVGTSPLRHPQIERPAASVAVLFAQPPTFSLGFDDLHRAALRIEGQRTPPPRSTSVATAMLRLSPLLTRLASAIPRLALRHTFPVSCAVLTMQSDQNDTDEERRIYFVKCLHVLNPKGFSLRYEACESLSSSTTSDVPASDASPPGRKRKWVTVGRDPVLVGVYRCPCHGHFDFAVPTEAPPALRLWTTRKRTGGLTVGSNAMVPDFMCTSLYGSSCSSVEMKAPSRRSPLVVFVDSDRVPTFDRDSSEGQPQLVAAEGVGGPPRVTLGVECSSVTIVSHLSIDLPLFPCLPPTSSAR